MPMPPRKPKSPYGDLFPSGVPTAKPMIGSAYTEPVRSYPTRSAFSGGAAPTPAPAPMPPARPKPLMVDGKYSIYGSIGRNPQAFDPNNVLGSQIGEIGQRVLPMQPVGDWSRQQASNAFWNSPAGQQWRNVQAANNARQFTGGGERNPVVAQALQSLGINPEVDEFRAAGRPAYAGSMGLNGRQESLPQWQDRVNERASGPGMATDDAKLRVATYRARNGMRLNPEEQALLQKNFGTTELAGGRAERIANSKAFLQAQNMADGMAARDAKRYREMLRPRNMLSAYGTPISYGGVPEGVAAADMYAGRDLARRMGAASSLLGTAGGSDVGTAAAMGMLGLGSPADIMNAMTGARSTAYAMSPEGQYMAVLGALAGGNNATPEGVAAAIPGLRSSLGIPATGPGAGAAGAPVPPPRRDPESGRYNFTPEYIDSVIDGMPATSTPAELYQAADAEERRRGIPGLRDEIVRRKASHARSAPHASMLTIDPDELERIRREEEKRRGRAAGSATPYRPYIPPFNRDYYTAPPPPFEWPEWRWPWLPSRQKPKASGSSTFDHTLPTY